MTKKRTHTGDIASEVTRALEVVRNNGSGFDEALATLETFCSMALELVSITNPSTVRKVATHAEMRRLLIPSAKKLTEVEI